MTGYLHNILARVAVRRTENKRYRFVRPTLSVRYLAKVRSALIDGGIEIDSAELQYVPNNTVPVDEETSAKVEKILDAIDDLDDVVAVHTNAE